MNKVFINGMFSFVLHDTEKKISIIVRDPIGIIPLYVGWDNSNNVWISSEMKALQNDCEIFDIFQPGNYVSGNRKRGR